MCDVGAYSSVVRGNDTTVGVELEVGAADELAFPLTCVGPSVRVLEAAFVESGSSDLLMHTIEGTNHASPYGESCAPFRDHDGQPAVVRPVSIAGCSWPPT